MKQKTNAMNISYLTHDELIELQGNAIKERDYQLAEAIERELEKRYLWS